ncbi:MAG: AAA family ATPase [Owenweeksia sp.]
MNNTEFDAAFDFVENTNLSFFLTGRAGTGKSTFLSKITSKIDKNFVVLAPTGISALNIKGVTIHSFFQFPPRPLLPKDKGIKTFWEGSEKRKLIESLDTLILDEASMVRADVIDAIDFSLRKNGGNPSLPFGGKQIVLVGDLYQLEPIVQGKNEETQTLNEIYGGLRFYQAHVFRHLKLFTIELKEVYRQKDPLFVSLLDKIRTKTLTNAELDQLNSRVLPVPISETGNHILTLTTKLDASQKINQSKLSELDGESRLYRAEISGNFDSVAYPSDLDLKLKIGAQVIFIKNNPEGQWVNGSLGIVAGLSDSIIRVELDHGGMCTVEKEVWENVKYKFNKDTGKVEQEVVGSYKQFPLKPSWAITVHKSQGMTFERLRVDFGDGTFAYGQAYVALSRVTSFEGLYLSQKVQFSDIQVDHTVKDFLKNSASDKLESFNIEGKRQYGLLKSTNAILVGNHYLHNALNDTIKADYAKGYEHLLKVFAYTSNDQDILRNDLFWNLLSKASEAINTSSQTSKPSYRLKLLSGTVQFLSGEHSSAIQTLRPCLKHDDCSIAHYLLAKSLWSVNEFQESLETINKALSLIQNSRNFFQKSLILNPYLKENEENDLVSKSLSLECNLMALNLDTTNIEAYKELKAFLTRGGLNIQLPSVEIFEKEIHKESLDQIFFDDIIQSLKKHKRKLVQAAAKSDRTVDETDFIDQTEVYPNLDIEELDDDVSEEELMEDMLDEFSDDESDEY